MTSQQRPEFRPPTIPLVVEASRGRPLIIPGGRAEQLLTAGGDGRPAYSLLPVRRGWVALIPQGLDRFALLAATHLARAVAVSRSTPSSQALSRYTAALLHGIRTWGVPDRPELCGPTRRRQGVHLDHVRHVAALPEEDVVHLEGLPVTSPHRTVLDIVRSAHPRDALVTADDLLRVAGGFDRYHRPETERAAELARDQLLGLVDELPAGARGRRRAITALTWASPWAESHWESHTRWVVLRWGRRDVIAQCPVETAIGTFFTDLAIPDGKRRDGSTRYLHVEFDGGDKYTHADPRERSLERIAERDRQRAIEALGDTMIRLDAKDAARPEVVVARIESELRGPRPRLRPVRELGEQR
ncbi:hypothetical protein [Georgenia sp. Z1491]|uniref:hypothetical protein n=1 Tax=Georgenia sp. Z1491 TaxID=3416707 RepID=UPI003CF79387